MLVTQVEQAHKLQGEAEVEANAAMNQLEDFIVEQEELVSILTNINIHIYIRK